MRGSLLAVVAIAVVLGLGVVALVRTMGWLSPPAAVAPPPAPAPVVVVPPPPPQVVVYNLHLTPGDSLDGQYVSVRPLRADELKEYDANKADYLPPSRATAAFRYAAKSVVADTPLKASDLAAVKRPEPLAARLAPGTRAIDLGLPKELAAGGLIATGDWVDVLVLTDVARTDSPAKVPQIGVLVQSAPVIAKRSSLFTIFAPPQDGLIGHTLAVNPYRAALLDYARSVGTLSLSPVSAAQKQRLDDLRARAMEEPTKTLLAIPFAEPGSPEYREEQDRIAKYARGELSVGRADLARVLQLAPPAPKTPAVQIELFRGTARAGNATFSPADPGFEYVFSSPTGPGNAPAPGTTVRPVAAPPKN
ncbi:Flp pilus assembly protein CpaB [Urbifossiella limnaea]|uniref:Flp pilus assembly protein RcpC/CpaB domain-containing protein n=1 Tax=Urbifossiella limnaea TaxID=2528023 RepID=A0A517Y3B7_9BACT|nr:Flp pilus assembly protein CpaB [Urbifossiella limnaea]QDU24296.1 hypothetical protein ETAA1_63100 [Urbifossiella limnaea]